jgi:adenylate kinase
MSNKMPSSPLNIVLLGFPGSGKSTQAKLLSERLGLAHVDMGSCLRKATVEDTEFGRMVNEIMNVRKELVSDDVVQEVLRREIERIPSDRGVILDGAPRRSSQIDEVESVFQTHGRSLGRVVFLALPEEESVRRIVVRRSCSLCRRPVILGKDTAADEDRCPSCGGVLEQRKDDTPEGVRKRLEVFMRETSPVIEYYRTAGKLLEADATLGIEELYGSIIKGLNG